MPTIRRVVGLIGALFIVSLGLLGGGVGLLAGVTSSGDDRLFAVTLAGSMLALSLGLGLPAAWQSAQALRGAPSAPFRPRRPWMLVGLLALSLVAGQIVLTSDLAPALTFPPLFVAAAALPPLAVVGLAGRGLAGKTRWRDVIVQLSSGAFISTLIAFVLEIGAVLVLVFGVALAVALAPGGTDRLQALADRLQDMAIGQDPALLAELAGSPWLALGVLAVLAGIVPLIEEAVKTLGVGLMAYRRPTQAQAFLWGLAGGAGFAVAEGLLNSATSLEDWGFVALSRVGATLVHCFTGGLMGLAWYHALSRRWGRAGGLYAGSVAAHAVWNCLAAVLAISSLRSGILETGPSELWATGWGPILAALFLVVAVSIAAGLAALVRRMRHGDDS